MNEIIFFKIGFFCFGILYIVTLFLYIDLADKFQNIIKQLEVENGN